MMRPWWVRLLLTLLVTAPRVAYGGLLDGLLGSGSSTCTPATCGVFSVPFAEPTIAGEPTSAKCITDASGQLIAWVRRSKCCSSDAPR